MNRYALITGSDPTFLLHFRTLLGALRYQVDTIAPDRPPPRPFNLAVVDARNTEGRHRLRALEGRGLVLALVNSSQATSPFLHCSDCVFHDPLLSSEATQALIREGTAQIGRPVDGPFGAIIGRAPRLKVVLKRIESFASANSNVLITGETGTGKELIARGIHDSSPRRKGPFVALNCAAIPESLVESELFGHVRGAFTGAVTAQPGRLAAAEGGTLFLDEVGELALPVQAKLLRVLQEREYTPLGEAIARRADVRIVVATNRDLQEDVRSGRFRADLYWRLEVITVELPPLRDRPGDIMPLVHHVIDRTNYTHHHQVTSIDQRSQRMLVSHPWPGNVRELENTIERAVILRGQGTLHAEDIILRRNIPASVMLGQVRLPPDGLDLIETTAALETLLIDQALEQSGGNRSMAARLLKINRTTLQEKLRRRESLGRDLIAPHEAELALLDESVRKTSS